MHEQEYAEHIRNVGKEQTTFSVYSYNQIEASMQESKKIVKEYQQQKMHSSNNQSQKGRSGCIQSMQETVYKDKNSLTFLDHVCTAYKFKSNQPIQRGQYRLPFTMKLPQKLPGTFHYTRKEESKDGQCNPEDLKIAYYFYCYIEGLKYETICEKEVIIRQFLFTEREIHEDLEYQKVVI